jgi:uncharacterized protein YyaL (SSP411 family)
MENPWVIQENFFNPRGKRQCKIMNIETLRQIWMQLLRVGTALILLLLSSMLSASSTKDLIQWQDWSEASFIRAKQENKLLLLNLEAVWCHWCHVMDQKTYSDPKVAQLINQHFIPIKVDHDARPDLANQYRDYGWPATIFLDAAGTDLVKRAGYIRPTSFVNLLSAIVADPTPERAALPKVPDDFAVEPALDPTIYQKLLQRHQVFYDPELGGLKTNQKTLDRDHVEFALSQSHSSFEKEVAIKTIQASFALADPEWGGIYQYSTMGDWQHPHFEKIMVSQAGFMRIYALAYQRFGDKQYLAQADAIAHYLAQFLQAANGAFYTSQDADLVQGEKGTEYFALPDKERRAKGIPRIDQNIYARENGWAIEALAILYEVSQNEKYLKQAERAAQTINQTHLTNAGGFKHSASDRDANYLADTLNMGAAFLQLYKVTTDRKWLDLANQSAHFLIEQFKARDAGYLSGKTQQGLPVQPVRHLDENIKTTRFLNLLSQYSGDESIQQAAQHGMKYIATPSIALARIEDSGILLAAQELSVSAPHFTVVGKKQDSVASELFIVGLEQSGPSQSGWYKRLEWWDKTEGPLQNSDVTYPGFDKPAGYVCVDKLCSTPAFTAQKYKQMSERILLR